MQDTCVPLNQLRRALQGMNVQVVVFVLQVQLLCQTVLWVLMGTAQAENLSLMHVRYVQ